jgi:TonB family protein
VVFRVTLVHGLTIISLLLWALFRFSHRPELVVMKVNLVSPPTMESPAPAAVESPPTPVPPAPVTPPPPRPPVPQPPPPRPVDPSPPPPRPTKPKPNPNAWKPRSPDEIRSTADLSRVRPTVDLPPPLTFSSDDIRQDLAQGLRSNVTVSVPPMLDLGTVSPADSRDDLSAYYSEVSRRLHGAWQKPDRSSVGNGSPQVGVSIKVRSDGSVASSRITSRSGVAAMDESVGRLLKGLRLPAFSKYGLKSRELSIDIVFELE